MNYRLTKREFLSLLGAGGGLLTQSLVVAPAALAADEVRGKGRLLQGPVAGAITPTSMKLWCRASDAVPLSIAYGPAADPGDAHVTEVIQPSADTLFSCVFTLTGLRPGTLYDYRILINGKPDPYTGHRHLPQFRTPALAADMQRFSVGFGSCARYAQDHEQLIWKALLRHRPDWFFWTGDNIYNDSADLETMADEYLRQRAVANYQDVAASIPQLAIWDDHDFGFNNSDGRNPIKQDALRIFKNVWANPAYGLPDADGVFFEYNYGGVDFFFLDGRYYRDPNKAPDQPQKTMLGRRQKDWLKERLVRSTAPFKVLVSGSGWSAAKGAGGDSWASYLHERNELFEFIRRENIGGVVLVSGDTHVAELNAIPWSEHGGYDMYDLVSSPLAQVTTTTWLDRRPERRIRQAFAGSTNFGLLNFELTAEPTLTFNAVDYMGATAWEPFTVRASELQNGVSTWLEKMDELSRRRYERAQKGEPYYQ